MNDTILFFIVFGALMLFMIIVAFVCKDGLDEEFEENNTEGTMVKIEGYLDEKDYKELIQYFWSMKCNRVDRPRTDACEKIVKGLEELMEINFPMKTNIL